MRRSRNVRRLSKKVARRTKRKNTIKRIPKRTLRRKLRRSIRVKGKISYKDVKKRVSKRKKLLKRKTIKRGGSPTEEGAQGARALAPLVMSGVLFHLPKEVFIPGGIFLRPVFPEGTPESLLETQKHKKMVDLPGGYNLVYRTGEITGESHRLQAKEFTSVLRYAEREYIRLGGRPKINFSNPKIDFNSNTEPHAFQIISGEEIKYYEYERCQNVILTADQCNDLIEYAKPKMIPSTLGEGFRGKNVLVPNKRVDLLSNLNFISPYIELPKKLTVKQNLEVYGRLYDVKNLNSKIDYLAEKLRLNEIIYNVTGELSSGQKNRVSLAKSIINDPTVLLLDEPTASLDPETGDFVRSFLESYQKEKGASILLASHNMTEVERLCSSVLMMKNGIIIDQDSPKKLIKKHGRKNLEEVFLKLTREKYES